MARKTGRSLQYILHYTLILVLVWKSILFLISGFWLMTRERKLTWTLTTAPPPGTRGVWSSLWTPGPLVVCLLALALRVAKLGENQSCCYQQSVVRGCDGCWVWQEGARPVLPGQRWWEDQQEPVQRGFSLCIRYYGVLDAGYMKYMPPQARYDLTSTPHTGILLLVALSCFNTWNQNFQGHHDAGHLEQGERCRSDDGGAKWCGVWIVLLVRLSLMPRLS